jgi:hypothetical protein
VLHSAATRTRSTLVVQPGSSVPRHLFTLFAHNTQTLLLAALQLCWLMAGRAGAGGVRGLCVVLSYIRNPNQNLFWSQSRQLHCCCGVCLHRERIISYSSYRYG